MSHRLQHAFISVSAVKAQCRHCESAENCQQELRRNVIECHASSVAMPWSLLGRHDKPFFTKNIRVFMRSHGALENWTIRCQHSGNPAWCLYTVSVACNCKYFFNTSFTPFRPWAGYRPPSPPRGNFVHYDFLKLHYVRHKIKDVSPLRVAALTCNSTLYTLPPQNSI